MDETTTNGLDSKRTFASAAEVTPSQVSGGIGTIGLFAPSICWVKIDAKPVIRLGSGTRPATIRHPFRDRYYAA